MPIQVSVECDNCGRRSPSFKYWKCRECGQIACDDCADKMGSAIGQNSIKQEDGFWATLGKATLGAIIRACPNCTSTAMIVVHDP